MKKVLVVKNRQHSLLEQQENLLKDKFGKDIEIQFINIPEKGMKTMNLYKLAVGLYWKCVHEFLTYEIEIVLLSPIPQLIIGIERLLRLYSDEYGYSICSSRFWIFLNDDREKKEVNGKVFYAVKQDGWFLGNL